MGNKTSIHVTKHPSLWEGLAGLLLFLLFAVSCSESGEADDEEFGNWQARNDAYFATLEDSLNRGGSAWKKIKTFTNAFALQKQSTENAEKWVDPVRSSFAEMQRNRLFSLDNAFPLRVMLFYITGQFLSITG
jgi:hypothetical protein